MWKIIKTIIITVLCIFGVLFIVLMLIPDDEEKHSPQTPGSQAVQETFEEALNETDDVGSENENGFENTATVSIPASEISDNSFVFRTETLDGMSVDQNIFADHDITLVHVWATFCGPCIREMGDYARSYEYLPDNVNIIGIVLDTYDGTDHNVDAANSILSDAGAGFMNLKASDSMYDVTSNIQVIPSSFFVDSDGHIIGEMMIGAGYDVTMKRLDKYLK